MLYDVLIIGGGPAGITAGIYLKRANKKVAILEKFAAGGQINLIGKIENYLGFESIEGEALAGHFARHAKFLEIPFIHEEAKEYELDGDIKKIKTRKNVYEAKCVIFALGCHSRALGINGEKKFKGRGVSYCAVCDGNFFKGKNVVVVGFGDNAVSDALYLADICQKVYLMTDRKMQLFMHNEEELKSNNITVLHNAVATEIEGEEAVEKIKYCVNSQDEQLFVDGVFVAVGRSPETEMLADKLKLDDKGFIITDHKMQTSLPGVYACGDVRADNIKQILTACGDGVVAATEAIKYVSLLNVRNLKN